MSEEETPVAPPAREAAQPESVSPPSAPRVGPPAGPTGGPGPSGPRPSGPSGPRPGGGGYRSGGRYGRDRDDDGPGGGMKSRRRPYRRRKVCAFCVEKLTSVDYKNVNRLKKFLNERGKIKPRRQEGTCAKHQRMICSAIKRGREMALIPYVVD